MRTNRVHNLCRQEGGTLSHQRECDSGPDHRYTGDASGGYAGDDRAGDTGDTDETDCLAQDIAETVLFLVSEASDYLTGQIVALNGGKRMLA